MKSTYYIGMSINLSTTLAIEGCDLSEDAMKKAIEEIYKRFGGMVEEVKITNIDGSEP